MPRPAPVFVCSACAAESAKWRGQCTDCGAWNTLVEEARAVAPGLLPSDARLVESVPADGVYPESQLYESEYLRERFAAADPVVVWGGTKPGTLTVEYLEVQDPGIGYFMVTRVSTGDSRVGR